MRKVQGVGASVAWVGLLRSLLKDGMAVSPRGIDTHELIGYTTRIDMNLPVVNVNERKLNYKFMAGEAWWILSGREDVESIAQFNSVIAKFSDDGIIFNGAYGPRIRSQLDYVLTSIGKDRDTRQAVLTIWERNPGPSKDIPCTVSIQFLVRDGFIYTNVFMRSSDAWLGWPYDVFNFSMLTRYVQLELYLRYGLALSLGGLTLMAGSQHLYNDNAERAREIIEYTTTALESGPGSQSNQQFDQIVKPSGLLYYLENVAHLTSNKMAKEALVYRAPTT